MTGNTGGSSRRTSGGSSTLKRKLLGHWNYYGIIGNSDQTSSFAWFAKKLVHKWLNRRSQRKLHRHVLRGCVGALANAGATVGRGGAATGRWTRPAPSRIKSSNKIPIVIEVPPARIPEEPGAVIPHAGICEGGVGQPASLP